MAERPSPEEVAVWQKRLASQANNRAWALAEALHRSPEEDEEMLQAAHAARSVATLQSKGTEPPGRFNSNPDWGLERAAANQAV